MLDDALHTSWQSWRWLAPPTGFPDGLVIGAVQGNAPPKRGCQRERDGVRLASPRPGGVELLGAQVEFVTVASVASPMQDSETQKMGTKIPNIDTMRLYFVLYF
jgi:hypothetical protein